MKGLRKMAWDSFMSVSYDAMTGKAKPWYKVGACYIFIPIVIFGLLFLCRFDMSDGMHSAFVAFLSLFIALIFQVIYIATDKFTSRYNDCWTECVRTTKEGEIPEFKEDVECYLIRIGNYTRLFVRQMTFVLILSVVIILLSVVEDLYHGVRLNIVLSSMIMSFFYLWLVYMIHSVKSIYILLMDDIDFRMKKI